MAFANTHLLSRLWLNRGLGTLLQTQTLPPELSFVGGKEQTLTPSRPVQPEFRPKPQRPPQANPSQVRPQALVKPAPAISALSLEAWPDIWQQLFRRVKAGNVLWTYHLLGSDLMQKPSPGLAERRGFLGRIVKDKPIYPHGTHTFWPYQLPDEAPQPELFWAGAKQLNARVVMILGLQAGQILLGRSVVPYSQHHKLGCHVVIFQEIQDLAQNLGLYGAMRRMLSDVLAEIGISPVA